MHSDWILDTRDAYLVKRDPKAKGSNTSTFSHESALLIRAVAHAGAVEEREFDLTGGQFEREVGA